MARTVKQTAEAKKTASRNARGRARQLIDADVGERQAIVAYRAAAMGRTGLIARRARRHLCATNKLGAWETFDALVDFGGASTSPDIVAMEIQRALYAIRPVVGAVSASLVLARGEEEKDAAVTIDLANGVVWGEDGRVLVPVVTSEPGERLIACKFFYRGYRWTIDVAARQAQIDRAEGPEQVRFVRTNKRRRVAWECLGTHETNGRLGYFAIVDRSWSRGDFDRLTDELTSRGARTRPLRWPRVEFEIAGA